MVRNAVSLGRLTVMALAASLLVACGGEEELPEAQGWQAPPPIPGITGAGDGHAGMGAHGGMVNPHAGMDPHGGMNPHAGMDPHGGMNPHAGMDPHGGMNPLAGFDPPDPHRAIDPSRYLRGAIRADESVRGHIDRGDILFLSVKPIDPASGEVIGGTIAAERLVVSEFPLAFELTELHMMVAGTSFEGHVVIEARVDGDGEALTRLPGDVEGSVRAEIPADGLDLILDSLVQ
jgi:hypothetical protein